jgi:hypothetical protein
LISYSSAEQPKTIAGQVINECYPELDRPEVEIVYVFLNKRDKNGIPVIPKRKGKEVWGDVKVVSGLNAYLAADGRAGNVSEEGEVRSFFVVTITQVVWNARFNEEQRVAFLDSMLSRCEYDSEKDKLSTREFDVREYHQVMKRRGAWHPELETFLKASKQMPLPNVAPPGKVRKSRTAHAGAGNA